MDFLAPVIVTAILYTNQIYQYINIKSVQMHPYVHIISPKLQMGKTEDYVTYITKWKIQD